MSEVTTQDSEIQQSPETGDGAEVQPALELDCRGMNCPLPILKTKKAIVSRLAMTKANPAA